MNYKIIKKTIGLKEQSVYFSFSLENKISDICCELDSIFFSHKHLIGLIVNNSLDENWSEQLYCSFNDEKEISSLTLFNNCIYCVKGGGSQIHKINLQDKWRTRLISDQNSKSFFDLYFRSQDSKTKIFVNKNNILWTVKDINRCFQLKDSIPKLICGNGKSGYSISTATKSRIFKPDGITKLGNLVIIADSGNKSLRGVCENSIIHLLSGYNELSKVIEKDGKLFFINGQSVYGVSLSGTKANVNAIYDSENKIISICCFDKKAIFILEEEK